LWGLWLANISIIGYFWVLYSGNMLIEGSLPVGIGLGRLAGLLATFCALLQFVLMSRGAWLEPFFGLDRLARFHRLNGYATLLLMLCHPLLLAWGYGALESHGLIAQIVEFWSFPYVLLAEVALVLFCITVGFSIYIVRKHLKFEAWYFIHLLNYTAIALLPWHQLTNGGELVSQPLFRGYWIALYGLVALNMLIWRFGVPLYRFWRHGFVVAKTVSEGPRATSVYLTGKHMDEYHAKGGQFVLVRYFQKGLWWQEHPFSLSRLPNAQGIRNTVRQLGDFTNQIPGLKPGTRVLVSGPYGAFTLDRARRDKLLYIAGGIGITPIRSMLEAQSLQRQPTDSVLLYANRDSRDIPLKAELDSLATTMPLTIHHVLNEDPHATEKGFVDEEKLCRLVPDLGERDVFLCGPPPMMNAVMHSLTALGVDKKHIHYERFSLHVR